VNQRLGGPQAAPGPPGDLGTEFALAQFSVPPRGVQPLADDLLEWVVFPLTSMSCPRNRPRVN